MKAQNKYLLSVGSALVAYVALALLLLKCGGTVSRVTDSGADIMDGATMETSTVDGGGDVREDAEVDGQADADAGSKCYPQISDIGAPCNGPPPEVVFCALKGVMWCDPPTARWKYQTTLDASGCVPCQ